MKRLLLLPTVVLSLLAVQAQSLLPTDSVLRRMAAQMLMVGFKGDSVDENSDAARYVRDLGVGAIILFDVDLTGDATIGSRNVTSKERLACLTRQLQAWAPHRLLIALDQEGGRVARLKPQYGYLPTVSAAYLGKVDCQDTTRHYARRLAQEMRQSGVNVNLAPVVDIKSDTPGLGRLGRCFSADVDLISRHAGWFIDENHRAGVCCAVKHFPGHGSAVDDSHWGFVDVTNTWSSHELVPFKKLIAAQKVDLVMTAHIFNRNIDNNYPATLSHKTITGVLRRQLGYDGVVVTDDMYMQGIIDNYSVERAIVLAINAGADMLCVGNNISTGFEADRPFWLVDVIVRAVKEGRIPMGRIIEANRRIERLQHKVPQS